MPTDPDDPGQGVHRARGQVVVSGRFGQRLGARLGHAGIAQAQLANGFAHETGLLAVALDQGHLQLRARDRQRDARQPGAGPQIGQGAGLQVGLHRQRVEQMAGDHLQRVADRGQVVGTVPAVQQGQVGQQRRCQRGLQAHRRQPALQRVGHAGRKCVISHAVIIASCLRRQRRPGTTGIHYRAWNASAARKSSAACHSCRCQRSAGPSSGSHQAR